MNILILHGPNLNLLGIREKTLYGPKSLEEIDSLIHELGEQLGISVECRQSNIEGELVTWIQEARTQFQGLVFNPAAYTHTSVALRDAVLGVEIPMVEVHISNIHKRESYRRRSFLASAAIGQISGFGSESYLLGLRAMVSYLRCQATSCS